jgi:hypothetical protein
MPLNAVPAHAAVSDWQRGGSIYPTWNGDFASESFKASLRNLKAAGANYVALIIPQYQANTGSSDIFAGNDTPTDASLISAINYAHSIGLHVMLKPHLNPSSGEWRANINAGNRNAWFGSYGAMLNHLADIGSQTGAEGMCIGTELISMASFTSNGDNTQRWISLINGVRSRFNGFLTYSANWGGSDFAEEVPHIGFWSNLDFVGISAYYPLAQGQWNPSVDALTGSWNFWNTSKVSAIHNQTGKPVLFTEIGYRSADNAHNEPWNPFGGGYNANEQVNDYEALFRFWNNQPWMNGIYMWNWNSDSSGGPGNTDYTPQGKPAQQTITSWWANGNNNPPVGGGGGTGTTTTGTTTPPGGTTGGSNTTFSMTGSVSPAQPVSGQSSTITVQASAKGTVTNALVDVEVYNSSGSKVFQKYFEGQNLNQTPLSLQTAWTPSATGNYTVRGGIFTSNWSSNLYWNDSIVSFTVGSTPTSGGGTGGTGTTTTGGGGGTTTPPPSGSFNTNIWWPKDGSSVNGVQPFKYNVDGIDASQYTGFWQVDGDRLNEMQTSTQDYPHKEVLVDVSGWSWKGNGPYTINFVSKDNSGNVISQKSVNITISR